MKKIWNRVCAAAKAVIKGYEFVELNSIILFTVFIGCAVMVEIVLRAFEIQGSRWIEEIARYMLVTTTFIGSSIAASQKGHMAMTALINLLPNRWANVMEIITNALCGGGFLWISVISFQWTGKLMATGKLMESISIPMWYLWVIISFSFLTTGIRFLCQIIKNVEAIRQGTYEAPPEKDM